MTNSPHSNEPVPETPSQSKPSQAQSGRREQRGGDSTTRRANDSPQRPEPSDVPDDTGESEAQRNRGMQHQREQPPFTDPID